MEICMADLIQIDPVTHLATNLQDINTFKFDTGFFYG